MKTIIHNDLEIQQIVSWRITERQRFLKHIKLAADTPICEEHEPKWNKGRWVLRCRKCFLNVT